MTNSRLHNILFVLVCTLLGLSLIIQIVSMFIEIPHRESVDKYVSGLDTNLSHKVMILQDRVQRLELRNK